MHYYPHHIGDFLRDTSSLSPRDSYIYLRLIWLYYESEKPLPDDLEVLAYKVGVRGEEQLISLLLRTFFRYDPDLKSHTHQRIDTEIAKYQRKANSARQANQTRWASEADLKSDTKSDARQIATNNQEPRTTNQEPSTNVVAPKRRKQLPDDFYPDATGLNAAGQKGVDVAVELQKFRDYHASKGSVMLDWQAAWRTWVGNARPQFSVVSKQSALEARNAEVARRFLASQEGV
jgi:uncharacterized protein YdaU (DUF1376 family)